MQQHTTHNGNARIDSTRTASADGSNAIINDLQSFTRKIAGKDLLFIFGSHFSFARHNIKPEFDIKTKNLI